jgi:hypothetical protein
MKMTGIEIVDYGYTGYEHQDWKSAHENHIKDGVVVKNCKRCELFMETSKSKLRGAE